VCVCVIPTSTIRLAFSINTDDLLLLSSSNTDWASREGLKRTGGTWFPVQAGRVRRWCWLASVAPLAIASPPPSTASQQPTVLFRNKVPWEQGPTTPGHPRREIHAWMNEWMDQKLPERHCCYLIMAAGRASTEDDQTSIKHRPDRPPTMSCSHHMTWRSCYSLVGTYSMCVVRSCCNLYAILSTTIQTKAPGNKETSHNPSNRLKRYLYTRH
jgi:hypothetical protein